MNRVMMKSIVPALACLLSAALPVCAQRYAVVNGSAIYMRLLPDYESPLETQELMGSVVEILAEDGYWRQIRCDQPYTAWTTRLELQEMNGEEIEAYKAAPKCIFTAISGKVYEGPTDKAGIISDLTMGDILRLGDRKTLNKSYVQVILPSGETGYVPKKNIMEKEKWEQSVSDASPEDVATLAKKFLGTPYLWGGMSPKGFDCSGLVRFCYMMNGVRLPRNAREMILQGEDVPIDELKTGDLLFFGDRVKGSVTHVGMYIGDRHFIHSSMTVRINSIDKNDADCYERIERLLCARRVMK